MKYAANSTFTLAKKRVALITTYRGASSISVGLSYYASVDRLELLSPRAAASVRNLNRKLVNDLSNALYGAVV